RGSCSCRREEYQLQWINPNGWFVRMPLDIDRLRDFAQRYTAAWCSGNPAAVAAFFAPDGSLSVNDGAPAEGRDAIALIAHSFMKSFPDLQVVMDDLRVVNGRVEYH